MTLETSLSVLCCPRMEEPGQVEYFPVGIFHERPDSDDFVREWYSAHLRSIHEPSLWQLCEATDAEFLRFLWVPTWSPPLAVRVEIGTDGATCIYGRMTSGFGGYGTGSVTHSTTSVLDREACGNIQNYLDLAEFWTLAAREVVSAACDGDQWIFERSGNGRYHVVDRWNPRTGPLSDLGVYLVSLSALPVAKERLRPVAKPLDAATETAISRAWIKRDASKT